MSFKVSRSVHFYETDMMGIVHHSNYLKWAEEGRVAWGFERGLLTNEKPEKAAELAVLETRVRHLKPARFGDRIQIELQVRREGIQIVFEYKIWKQNESEPADQEVLCEIRTHHVGLDTGLGKVVKLTKPSAEIRSILEKEKWTETWLLSL